MTQRFHTFKRNARLLLAFTALLLMHQFATCKYGFKDAAPIPAEVKNFRVNYFENKAQYINSRLSPELTEKLKQKIINTTRLRQTNSDDAHYDISGYVSQYYTTTQGITGNTAGTNRLHVGFHLSFVNTLDENKNFEADLIRTFDFPSTQSLDQAESALNDEIVRNVVDEIFNRIFSNW
ncbi:MAG TPA: LPS assembly lipoprotein LptE [Ferruginibacter sp.]|nr:LPS assembly lipoprotein LptE [Ferruginibacter sp.]HRO18716.1 LPS assembly lipoprotein LptE [Ferruginibacter sp.]HRQ21579.1 LPS assembly lipoprotein LptE [Ferruginibacter sp.]